MVARLKLRVNTGRLTRQRLPHNAAQIRLLHVLYSSTIIIVLVIKYTKEELVVAFFEAFVVWDHFLNDYYLL